ncbi:rna-directed dna polymerase from mobile element jockey-like [Limosa lapponica baueri]|uniref:Rna-directed dna polymerase from mobile element jockey-like n=1 Tax=Limosa lapponica baueri TaxID=1758121 RepID=A0A2I0ULU5_LIMLA|nr:rna-directed dna polymerase from mobile element jockey-like [Limosa lapponica baueri]
MQAARIKGIAAVSCAGINLGKGEIEKSLNCPTATTFFQNDDMGIMQKNEDYAFSELLKLVIEIKLYDTVVFHTWTQSIGFVWLPPEIRRANVNAFSKAKARNRSYKLDNTTSVSTDDPSLQGLVLGLVLFNIFVGHVDSGTECTLSKFANDTKLCVVIDRLEGRDAIQRDLDRLDRWVCVSLMKFKKAKCKVLHMGRGNPKHKYRLGGEWTEGSPEEDLGVLVDEKLTMSSICACSPESQPYPGLHQKKCGQQVKGGNSAPVLCSGARNMRRTWTC